MCPNHDDSFEKTASQIRFDPALSWSKVIHRNEAKIPK